MIENQYVKKYIPILNFISEIMGENCEVALHDLSSPEASIIALKNGHLSGREVGGPSTDLVLKILQNKSYKEVDYIANYKATGKLRTFRSSSYFIKDDDGEIVGVLCVNIDTAPFENALKVLETLPGLRHIMTNDFNIAEDNKPEASSQEQLSTNLEDLIYDIINDAVKAVGVPPDRMTSEEKQNVVKILLDKGAFYIKGAAREVAKIIDVSEPTVYRYINKGKE